MERQTLGFEFKRNMSETTGCPSQGRDDLRGWIKFVSSFGRTICPYLSLRLHGDITSTSVHRTHDLPEESTEIRRAANKFKIDHDRWFFRLPLLQYVVFSLKMWSFKASDDSDAGPSLEPRTPRISDPPKGITLAPGVPIAPLEPQMRLWYSTWPASWRRKSPLSFCGIFWEKKC